MINLKGERQERTLEEARRRVPMNAAQVRFVIDQMEIHTKSLAARKSLAKHAIEIGNVTEEGKSVYREYLNLLK